MPEEEMYAKTLTELRALSDEALAVQHDHLARGKPVIGVRYYLDELARRRSDRQARTMTRLTWVIAALTVINVVLVTVDICSK